MARWTGHDTITSVLEAATRWKAECFISEGSILSTKSLWTGSNLVTLSGVFDANPIVGTEQNFYGKLKLQLETSPPHIVQLAAEILWFVNLFPSTTKAETKRNRIREVWAWSGEELEEDAEFLKEEYLAGVGSPGTYFQTNLPNEFGFSARVMAEWKKRPPAERDPGNDIAAAWQFASWLDQQPDAENRPMRNAILYLAFPDYFERNLSVSHRQEIYRSLHRTLPIAQRAGSSPSALSLDKALFTIRTQLQEILVLPQADFYVEPLLSLWKRDKIEGRRRQVASAVDAIVSNYNLEIAEPGSKKKTLEDTRPVDETTGYWKNPSDATNKPLRWIVHFDLTLGGLVASVPALHGSDRIAYLNAAQGRSGAVIIRVIPAFKTAENNYEFFDSMEWLLVFSFMPSLAKGSSGQLIENFDPETGTFKYLGKEQPYIGAALVGLNDPSDLFPTKVGGAPRTVRYSDLTVELGRLLHTQADMIVDADFEGME
ncbi:hypothetical protein [Devosia neptuniae]|uniref:hypothetical protein n=1 Tax=Devosia neptuniae TaxID=191302 RepID=UPI0022AE7FF4|nr:hypothetical protein [Devosia neptuniae]MCZ4346440.1 hypothetical protein [Devosia neptuniae]